jgi:hypothetical protein
VVTPPAFKGSEEVWASNVNALVTRATKALAVNRP